LTGHGEGGLIRDVGSYLRQLAAVAGSTSNASRPEAIMSALAEAQRVAAWGLRSAVALGREQGLSWRQLADLVGIPASTLHRQFRSGTAIQPAPESRPLDVGPPGPDSPEPADHRS